ncbi:hypothetical protein Lser_V15G11417 [Lactuca serriola]
MHHLAVISSSKLSNWVSKIKELSFSGRWQDVLSLYNDMNKAGVRLTEPSLFHPILKACSAISLAHGKSLHASVIKLGVESSTSIGNSIMDFYTKAGDVGSTISLFGCMKIRDSVSWNILISGQIDHGDLDQGIRSFIQARATGFEPNVSTLVLVIQTIRTLKALHEEQKIHGYMIKTEFLAISSLQNSLLSMYADTTMEYAQKLFDEMPNRDVITWSVMISGYVKTNKNHLALQIFKEMLSQSGPEPDEQTILSALKACTNLKNLITGRTLHGFIFHKGFHHDTFLGNSLIDMYSKCNDTDSALQSFTEIPLKNIISWNSIISGLVYNEKHSEAIHLFDTMQNAKIDPDAVTLVNLLQICKHFTDPLICKSIHTVIIRRNHELNDLVVNTLVDTYAKCNLIFIAHKLFSLINIHDVVSWSTMIAAFTYCGFPHEAIRVFHEMMIDSQHKPNAITMLNLIEACSYDSDLKLPKSGQGIAIRLGFASDAIVGTSILDMYAKYGDIMTSKKVFEMISNKNVVSYSAMIGAYGMNGVPHSALSLLTEMESHGVKPNSVTILSVLSACSHGGLVHEGLSLFRKLTETLEVKLGVEHYSCLVDLLSRSGNLDLAMKMVEGHEKGGVSAWGALLSGCRFSFNERIAEKVVSCVLEMEPNNSNGYMLASNMYAKLGSWEDVARIRGLMRDKEVKSVAGFSMINVNNKSCRFVAGDRNQVLLDEIRDTIKELHEFMKMDH